MSLEKNHQSEKSNPKGELTGRLHNQNNYSSLLRRFLAYMIDFFISSIFVSIIPMIITSIITQEKTFSIRTFTQMPTIWQIICGIIAISLAIYYFCLYPMNKNHLGQTIGKRIMKLRIVNVNGQDLTYKDIFLRELLGSMIIEGETKFPSAFFRYFLYKMLPAQIAGVISIVSIVLSVASIIWAIINRRHRMFHDYVGRTVVVKIVNEK
ncbi:RDD family protein [Oceanobacillus jeddahense]|uniref:RDD family protein n=1 Tax=Oceanobacillus jeddahense TaxID=1462527 RepID=A0ABY5JLC5_9BACI|nr:RDD family protein [Oceanobacillus jeddahense]UUI01083.1 RDD family protein [Oceanobacillus jeddahense]